MQQVGQVAEKFKNKEKVKMSQQRCSRFKDVKRNSFPSSVNLNCLSVTMWVLGIQRFVTNKKEDFSSQKVHLLVLAQLRLSILADRWTKP